MNKTSQRLAALSKKHVTKLDDCIGHDIEYYIDEMVPGEIVVLENLRFYDEEKKKGLSPNEAMAMAISKIGRAIVTTALTTLGGFGVLIASDFVMIRDFGIATVVGVFLCLIIPYYCAE